MSAFWFNSLQDCLRRPCLYLPWWMCSSRVVCVSITILEPFKSRLNDGSLEYLVYMFIASKRIWMWTSKAAKFSIKRELWLLLNGFSLFIGNRICWWLRRKWWWVYDYVHIQAVRVYEATNIRDMICKWFCRIRLKEAWKGPPRISISFIARGSLSPEEVASVSLPLASLWPIDSGIKSSQESIRNTPII